MKKLALLVLGSVVLLGCGGAADDVSYEAEAEPAAPLVVVEAPEPMVVPEAKEVSSEDDWEARAHNKNIEVIQVLNIINPVAAYIIAGFEQYGDSFSPVLNEEWEDTQVQLGQATTLYATCQERLDAGEYDKKLFLDLEQVWQTLVKTGVAGVRTKSMVDSEISRLKG